MALGTLRTLGVSRIYLDNFDHLTAYWMGLVPQSGMAQVALSYGVDDLHGTIEQERIFHMAGATSPYAQTRAADDPGDSRSRACAGAAGHV